jgi:WD40 repeat protein
VSGSSNYGLIIVWDIKTKSINKTKDVHSSGVYSLAVISNELIASGSTDKTIKIWNITSDEIIKTLYGHEGAPQSLLALSDKKLATGSTMKFIIFDIETEESFSLLKDEGQLDMKSLALLPTNNRFANGFKNYIIIWSFNFDIDKF